MWTYKTKGNICVDTCIAIQIYFSNYRTVITITKAYSLIAPNQKALILRYGVHCWEIFLQNFERGKDLYNSILKGFMKTKP